MSKMEEVVPKMARRRCGTIQRRGVRCCRLSAGAARKILLPFYPA